MDIIRTSVNDADIIARIISQSNKDVAQKFKINADNNPKHPSFYTEDWVLSDFDKGEEYFLYRKDNAFVACVAFETPRPGVAYLNRLSVLPAHQEQGIGSELVQHIIDHAKRNEMSKISIGIIAEHSQLKNWYKKLGFIEGEEKTFEHLPFNVCYLSYPL